jgi:hypothetical protein
MEPRAACFASARRPSSPSLFGRFMRQPGRFHCALPVQIQCCPRLFLVAAVSNNRKWFWSPGAVWIQSHECEAYIWPSPINLAATLIVYGQKNWHCQSISFLKQKESFSDSTSTIRPQKWRHCHDSWGLNHLCIFYYNLYPEPCLSQLFVFCKWIRPSELIHF